MQNDLTVITSDVVETARSILVIGDTEASDAAPLVSQGHTDSTHGPITPEALTP